MRQPAGPGPKPAKPTGPTPTGPRRVNALQDPWGKPTQPRPGPPPPKQRCTDERPHGPHPVSRRGTWTPFQCAGRPTAAELERELAEAFGEHQAT